MSPRRRYGVHDMGYDEVTSGFYGTHRDTLYISRIMIRALETYQEKFSYSALLECLLNCETNFGDTWKEIIEKKRTDYLAGNTRADKDYVSLHNFIRRDEMLGICRIIREENPALNEPSEISYNVKFLAELLDLTEVETQLLQFFAYITNASHPTCSYFSQLGLCFSGPMEVISITLGIDSNKLRDAYENGLLFKCGLLTPHEHHDFRNFFEINYKIAPMILCNDPLTEKKLEATLFPNNLSTSLTLDDYHQKKEIEIMCGLIDNALKHGHSGINILLYGLAGSGKTELTILLSRIYGWELKVIGDIDDNEDQEKGRELRLMNLKIAIKLFKNLNRPVVLLFDEMEDLFKIDTKAQFSKAFLNRLIEKTPIPIVWTTNELRPLGEHVIRRMTYSIPFKIPPIKHRVHVWKKYNEEYGLKLPENDIVNLAEAFDVVPALVANTAKVAGSNQLPAETIQEVMVSLDTAMNFGHKRKFDFSSQICDEYDHTLVNSSLDIVKLTERISQAKPNFSLCIYGPAGTGKSAYARYLSRVLGLRPLQKRASDLLSMWVGQTEQNIADAFEEAKESERFLIFDEADSMLHSRKGASQSWEISQVNEMLTQMENHPLPFVCTTNLVENLDEASLRRFTFKIKFDFLKPEQARLMFLKYFKCEAPKQIGENQLLTPGDFANIKKKANIMGVTDSVELYEMLVEECEMKPQFTKKIGF